MGACAPPRRASPYLCVVLDHNHPATLPIVSQCWNQQSSVEESVFSRLRCSWGDDAGTISSCTDVSIDILRSAYYEFECLFQECVLHFECSGNENESSEWDKLKLKLLTTSY